MKRPLYVVGGGVVLLGVFWLAWASVRDRQLVKGFDQVKPGTTEQEVVQSLGRPKRVEKCGDFLGPIPKVELEGCAREYLYATPFAPVLPQYYVVRFDKNDRVKNTAAYSSP